SGECWRTRSPSSRQPVSSWVRSRAVSRDSAICSRSASAGTPTVPGSCLGLLAMEILQEGVGWAGRRGAPAPGPYPLKQVVGGGPVPAHVAFREGGNRPPHVRGPPGTLQRRLRRREAPAARGGERGVRRAVPGRLPPRARGVPAGAVIAGAGVAAAGPPAPPRPVPPD